MPKVWLITGSGSGLGREIAEAALSAGDFVVAGARRMSQLSALTTKYGSRVVPVLLDVRDEEAAKSAVNVSVKMYGRLDVLVNNAGYQRNAPFEQITAGEFRDVIETCLFGVVNTTRAAIPVMRAQRSGHIFQVSSIGGRVTIPGNSPYHAAKFAVGGFSDSIAAEVAEFGVKVCTLEPGGIRTDFAQRASENLPPLLPDYESSVGEVYSMLTSSSRNPESDPKRIADVVLKLASMDAVPRRLILGKAADAYVEKVEKARSDEAAKYRAFTLSTVFPESAT
jgi:NAD(P)-dependent dehydrogenase (short-subunit alcohol dehydrogenase family)